MIVTIKSNHQTLPPSGSRPGVGEIHHVTQAAQSLLEVGFAEAFVPVRHDWRQAALWGVGFTSPSDWDSDNWKELARNLFINL